MGNAPRNSPDRFRRKSARAGEGAKILEVGFNAGHSVCLMMCLGSGPWMAMQAQELVVIKHEHLPIPYLYPK